jgi:integrase
LGEEVGGVERKFAAYLHTIDPAVEVPPPGVFPARRHRPTPYLWSQGDICRLLEGARALRPPLRAASHETLFGLLAASGMRVDEAVALQRNDVDLGAGVVTIRQAKFDRSRLVPLHPSATEALRAMWPNVTGCAPGHAQTHSSCRAAAPLSTEAAWARRSGRSRLRWVPGRRRCVHSGYMI